MIKQRTAIYLVLVIFAGLLVWRQNDGRMLRHPPPAIPTPVRHRGGPAETELRSSRPSVEASGKNRHIAGNLKKADSNDAGTFKDWLENPPDFGLLFPQEYIEKILRENNNRVDLLLAAVLFRSYTAEPEFKQKLLKELAAAAGDQAAVQAAMILAGNLMGNTTEGMKEWIDRLKASDPQNALANYFAAIEAFKRNDPDTVLAELLTAQGKTGYNDYMPTFWDAREEFFRTAGYPEAEAKMLAASGLLMPNLAEFRQVANSALDTATKRQETSDYAGALEITGSISALGRQLEQSTSGTLVEELVGIALETKALNEYKAIYAAQDDTAGTARVNQRLAELEAIKQEIKTLTPALDPFLKTADSATVAAYFDRMRQYGELQALRDLAAGKIP